MKFEKRVKNRLFTRVSHHTNPHNRKTSRTWKLTSDCTLVHPPPSSAKQFSAQMIAKAILLGRGTYTLDIENLQYLYVD